MSSRVSSQVLYKIANAPICEFPFPHIYVRDVFPTEFYREVRAHLPPKEAFHTLSSSVRVKEYPDSRLVLKLPFSNPALDTSVRQFWDEVGSWLLGGSFGRTMVIKFAQYLEPRLGDLAQCNFYDEALLVQDYTTYSLGPHTDNPNKVLSFLFYLPADDTLAHLGTSIYVPSDSSFQCDGTKHYAYENFLRAADMPFLSNSLFAFAKSSNSFHGVEPVTEANVHRDLLLYDIKVKNPPEIATNPVITQSAAGGNTRFSF
jgi:hypothetical protein